MATREGIEARVTDIAQDAANRAKSVLSEVERRTPQAWKDAYDRTAPRVGEAYRRLQRSAPEPLGRALHVAEDTITQVRDRVSERLEERPAASGRATPPKPTVATSTRRSQRSTSKPSAPAAGATTAELKKATKGELYERAQELDIPGRSKMSKDELVRALSARS